MATKNVELSVLLVVTVVAGSGCASPTTSSADGKDAKGEARSLPPSAGAQSAGSQRQAATTESAAERSSRGFVTDIEQLTEQNSDFRRVIYTANHSQIVVMALPPGEHIGTETHGDVDQFFRVEEGRGEVMMGPKRISLHPGSAIVIPAGTKHDVSTVGDKPLKLYTIYSPPQHRDGVVHRTRADAEHDPQRFDGTTTD